MEEKIFFNKGNVSVSNSRFIVDGQTYAMSNVTSVKSGKIPAANTAALVICLIGLMCLLGTAVVKIVGIIFIVVGIIAYRGAKPQFTVVLNTSAGENKALSSEDEAYVDSIIQSLNDAIVSRG